MSSRDLGAFQKEFARAVRAESVQAQPTFLRDDNAWRFSVYRNNFFNGLIEQLKEAYPTVRQILGEEAFFKTARRFLIENPPTSRSLALFGEGFPHYLSAHPETNQNIVACDMAHLERAWLEALHAGDADPLAPETLASVGERLPEARFVPHPAARIVASQVSIVDHWRVRRPGNDGPTSQIGEVGAQGALVTRPKLSVQISVLTNAERVFGENLFRGEPVSLSFDDAVNSDPAFDLTQAFRKYLVAGAFTKTEL